VNYQEILVSFDGPCGLVTLNRPDKLNAISKLLMSEVASAISACNGEKDIRGIVITGSTKTFSTGADLEEAVAVRNPVEYRAYSQLWRNMLGSIERAPKPVIAAINGFCVTGGLELAMACDLRIASEGSKFAITSAKIGSVAGAGGTQRLPRLVGPANAKDMLFTSRFVDATEAFRIGLINRLVPTGTALEAAQEYVGLLTRQAPLSLAWLKQAVNTGMNTDLESALDFEASVSGAAFASADKEEGMRAFLEKRDPVFQGV
jgi:enoyl-CoA hydratase/carnithine racemase